MDYGIREFAVQDPDGYLIAFAEPARNRHRIAVAHGAGGWRLES
jgi:hypothetical protein